MDLWSHFFNALTLLWQGDSALWQIVFLSLRSAVFALFIAAPFALVLGYQLAYRRFWGRRWVIALLQVSLSIPTVLIGLVVYMLLSRQGMLGAWHWLFTQKALILGQALIAFPMLTALALTAVQSLDARVAETAMSLGARSHQVMWTVFLELRFAMVAALIHAFGRVVSEVGCAMMVGGNIAGVTRTMTTAIALETSKGEFAQGIALGLVLLMMALLMNGVLMLVQGDAGEIDHGRSVA